MWTNCVPTLLLALWESKAGANSTAAGERRVRGLVAATFKIVKIGELADFQTDLTTLYQALTTNQNRRSPIFSPISVPTNCFELRTDQR